MLRSSENAEGCGCFSRDLGALCEFNLACMAFPRGAVSRPVVRQTCKSFASSDNVQNSAYGLEIFIFQDSTGLRFMFSSNCGQYEERIMSTSRDSIGMILRYSPKQDRYTGCKMGSSNSALKPEMNS